VGDAVTGEVCVVCRPEVAAGFRLAGLGVHPAADAQAAELVLAGLRSAGRTGVVLLEDQLRSGSAPVGLPLVVPFPGPSRVGQASEVHLIELLRRAIGYRVRLR
jgi:vacuolar-type H+-ATPase subunit F/Vma7